MKNKIIFLLVSLLFAGTGSLMAQGGAPRRTVEERVKAVMEKFADFNLNKDKTAQVDSIFTNFFNSQDKIREEMMNNGQRDFQAMREKMQPLRNERDEKLKNALTEDQYKKWKDEIEPSLRPQRGGGGGRPNNG